MLRQFRHRAVIKALFKRLKGEASAAAIPAGGNTRNTILQAIFVLLGKLAKSDGLVSPGEARYAASLMARLGLTPRQRQEAIDHFELGKQDGTDALAHGEALADHIGCRSELARCIMDVLLEMAHTKGCMRLKEKSLLRNVAQQFGFDQAQFQQMIAQFNGGAVRYFEARPGTRRSLLRQAYNTLQLPPDAPDSDLKPAYLRLMTRYHPDKLMSDNLPDDARRMAREKATSIRTAYDEIRKFRRLQA